MAEAESLATAAQLASGGTDLHDLSRRLGVASIEYVDSLQDEGTTSFIGDAPVVALRAGTPERTRFTLAHELAHVLLWHHGLEPGEDASRGARSDHERFCDAIAGAFLMPSAVYAMDAKREPGFEALSTVARRAGVSLTSAAIRMSHIGPHKWPVLKFRRAKDVWLPWTAAALPMRASVQELSLLSPDLDRLQAHAIHRLQLCLKLSSRSWEPEADIVVRRITAIAVVAEPGPDLQP